MSDLFKKRGASTRTVKHLRLEMYVQAVDVPAQDAIGAVEAVSPVAAEFDPKTGGIITQAVAGVQAQDAKAAVEAHEELQVSGAVTFQVVDSVDGAHRGTRNGEVQDIFTAVLQKSVEDALRSALGKARASVEDMEA